MMINSKTTIRGQTSAIELVLIIPVIIAAVIVFILLVPNYSYTAGSEVNTFTLNAMAQSLLEYIITNPGNPPNWGLATQPSSFGLAMPNQPYHLDPFKVMALAYWELANYKQSSLAVCYANQTATGFQQFLSQYGITALYNSFDWVLTPTAPTYWLLNYTAVKQMLGLGRNYNFMLVIYPVFRVKIIPINGTQLATFLVNVTKFDTGQPVPNATVYVSYIAISFSSNNKEKIVVGNVTGITNNSGSFVFTIKNMTPSSTNFYYINAYASLGGLGDHGLYFNSTNNPLLTVIILPSPNASNINWVIFAHPHVLKGCIPTCNPGQTALGLRVVGVFKSIYNYTFSALNFTLSPGGGLVSYPNVTCQYLTTSQKSNNYSDCYWALPQTPMLLIAFVTRNPQSTSCNTPLTQIIVIPYGMLPEYYLSNREIIFGYSEKYAPVGTAKSIVYIGDSAYYVTLYLYYGGNVFGPMG